MHAVSGNAKKGTHKNFSKGDGKYVAIDYMYREKGEASVMSFDWEMN